MPSTSFTCETLGELERRIVDSKTIPFTHDDALGAVSSKQLVLHPIANAIVPYSARPYCVRVMRCHQQAVEPYAVFCMVSGAQPTMLTASIAPEAMRISVIPLGVFHWFWLFTE
jgi:hypothetical protein